MIDQFNYFWYSQGDLSLNVRGSIIRIIGQIDEISSIGDICFNQND